MQARAVTLLAWDPGVTRSLKAAVARFRHVPVQMLVLMRTRRNAPRRLPLRLRCGNALDGARTASMAKRSGLLARPHRLGGPYPEGPARASV